jgi:hypothetical protein
VGGEYNPEPIDTAQFELDEELEHLVLQLLENTHDNWATQRMKEGWSYGPRRDDELKQHPDLVPFEELSEDEKQYDRLLVTETLKAVLALGYEIRKR